MESLENIKEMKNSTLEIDIKNGVLFLRFGQHFFKHGF
jgi:hypothetical protein